jgi:outer membrane protein W
MLKTIGVAVAAVLVTAPAWAQHEGKVEASVNAGWTFSDGVGGANVILADGNAYDSIGPKDSFSWGLTLGYNFTPNWGLEFIYDQQESKLEIGGTNTLDLGDFKISNYHGAFVYSFGEESATARPYVLFGAGATSYPGLTTSVFGTSHTTQGNTKFSGTVGLGVKIYPGHNVGLKLQTRWTPTYIKSDSTGYWCDPYWGCYATSNAQYSNQFELTGGLTFRF